MKRSYYITCYARAWRRHCRPDETFPLMRRHSAGVFEFCSGLVDLVVGVGRDGGHGHRLTFPSERAFPQYSRRAGPADA
jgi:hypothetical protein